MSWRGSCFKLVGSLSYPGFKLLRKSNSKCMMDIQGKLILVWVSKGSRYWELTVFRKDTTYIIRILCVEIESMYFEVNYRAQEDMLSFFLHISCIIMLQCWMKVFFVFHKHFVILIFDPGRRKRTNWFLRPKYC